MNLADATAWLETRAEAVDIDQETRQAIAVVLPALPTNHFDGTTRMTVKQFTRDGHLADVNALLLAAGCRLETVQLDTGEILFDPDGITTLEQPCPS